jgi:hypothetical protein
MPIFLPDGQNAGVNNLPNPCGGSTSPPPPPPPTSKLACPALLKSPSPPFTPLGSNADARWVDAVYHDLLNLTPTGADSRTWTTLLLRGESREVVVAFEEGDPDHPLPTQGLVTSIYKAYLNRAPSASELGSGVGALESGETDEQFAAAVLGSPEFFSDAGGTATTFVNGLYNCLLGRSPLPSELNNELNQLAGGKSDADIATAVLATNEYRTDLVNSWYLRFLRHSPGSSASFYINALGAGKTDEQVIAAFLGSLDYWHLFNPATLGKVTIKPNGSIKLTLAHSATITMQVSKLINNGTRTVPVVQHALAASTSFKLPKLKRLGAVNFGHQRKGHHTLHWNRSVGGKRLSRGTYEVVVQVRRGGKLVDVSDAIPFKVR